MVYIKKSKPTPEIAAILNKEKSKKNGSYLVKSVIDKIEKDFFKKCYLCESKKPTTINIEHFIPHENDKELKSNFAAFKRWIIRRNPSLFQMFGSFMK